MHEYLNTRFGRVDIKHVLRGMTVAYPLSTVLVLPLLLLFGVVDMTMFIGESQEGVLGVSVTVVFFYVAGLVISTMYSYMIYLSIDAMGKSPSKTTMFYVFMGVATIIFVVYTGALFVTLGVAVVLGYHLRDQQLPRWFPVAMFVPIGFMIIATVLS